MTVVKRIYFKWLLLLSVLLFVALDANQVDAQNKKAVQQEITFTVNTYTTESITVNGKRYTYNNLAKKLFTKDNEQALNGAEITVDIKNDTIIRVKDISLQQGGTEKKPLQLQASISIDSLTINAAYVQVKNMSVKSNIIITNKATGNVIFKDVFVYRKMVVSAVKSTETNRQLHVQFQQTPVRQMIIERTGVQLTTNLKIPSIVVAENVSSLQLDAPVTRLIVENSPNFTLSGKATIYNIVALRKSNIILNYSGTVQFITFHHLNSSLRIASNVQIANVELPHSSQVTQLIQNFSSAQLYIGKIYVGGKRWIGEQVEGVESLQITSLPIKTQYITTENVLNLNGMTVVARLPKDKTVVVTNYRTSQVDFTKLGQQTVTVSYGGKTATFLITITPPKTFNYVAASKVTDLPTGVTYQNGKFSLTNFSATSFTFKDGITVKRVELVKGQWQVTTVK